MSDTTLEVMSEEDCLACLRQVSLGRIAVVTADGRPEIFPVNFALHEGTVVIVTSSAVIKARAPLGHVAFEADFIDRETKQGWDVVVNGEGADITDTVDHGSLMTRNERVEHWAPGVKDFWVSIVNPTFSGRRLRVAAVGPNYF